MLCDVYAKCVYRHHCLLETQCRWCAICASGNGAGPMATAIWLMHLAKPSHEPKDTNGKKAAQNMQPSCHFAKTDTKSVTHFRAVFSFPRIHHVENHHFTTVKTQFLICSILWFCKKCTTTSAVFNPAGCLCMYQNCILYIIIHNMYIVFSSLFLVVSSNLMCCFPAFSFGS